MFKKKNILLLILVFSYTLLISTAGFTTYDAAHAWAQKYSKSFNTFRQFSNSSKLLKRGKLKKNMHTGICFSRSKAEPFSHLMKEIYHRDNLWLAWSHVRRNQGAGGVDKESVKTFQSKAKEELERLHHELKSNTYQPLPALQILIPKPGQGGKKKAP